MRLDSVDRIVLKFLGQLRGTALDCIPESSIRELRDAIREAIDNAVAREREACADIAESLPLRELIAASIRSRRRRSDPDRRWDESPTAT